jgi:diguanylate cyclase (GGDEF)-like protein
MPIEGQENLIFSDDLTGLYNRRYLYSQLPRELEEAQANKSKLWLFMLDIDNFKMINDTFGHLSGDDLIKEVAVAIKENTKSNDKRIRYAGDEFTVILPGIESKDVISIANRLVTRINERHFKEKHSGKEMHVTVSVGIAGYPQDTSDPIELINLADKALYISKQKGKNCFSVVSEITPELFWKKGLLERFPCPVLVGRNNELRKLNETLKQVFGNASSFILASGELGIGKSRLLIEFEHAASEEHAVILSLRCEDKFLNQPFYAVGEPLNRHLIGLDNIPADFLAGIPENEIGSLAAFMPVLKDIASSGTLQEEAISDDFLTPGLIKLLLNISRHSPLCFILDELHYIDEKSLKIITRLIQENRDARVMVAAAFSQDELVVPDMEESPLAVFLKEPPKYIQPLALSPLPKDAVVELISNILLNIPLTSVFFDAVYNKARGNPLFVEELLKYMIEKDYISFRNGRWLQQEIDETKLPSSLEGTIKMRLEGLDEETKEMIAKAAVIGENFQVDLLQKIDSEDRGYVLDLIEAGKKIGLIYEKGSAEKGEFGFATNEIRNILFEAMGGERTRHLYGRVGEIQEKLHPENLNSIAGELYYNFKKAEDQVRAEQYAKIVREGKGALYDRTIQYAQSLLEEVVQDKILLPLSKKNWAAIPALIRSISLAAVNYTLYPAQNKMRIQSVEDAYKKLSDILTEAEILNIAVIESGIIVNNKKVGKELPSFYVGSFISALKNLNIESITIQKGTDIDELNKLIGVISMPELKDMAIAELWQKQNSVHIQLNEITYDVSKRKFKEKESLEEIMLMDYLLGKLPSADNKADLSGNIVTHAQEIAEKLEKLGEQVSAKTGKDKEAVKAEIMAKSIQKIGRQFLDKGEDWSKYREGLAKTILSMEPQLRASVFSQELPREARDKEDKGGPGGKGKTDIIKEIGLELPDEVISDVLVKQYTQKDTDWAKMKAMVARFLATPEKKARLTPILREQFKQLGASDDECDLIFEEKNWEQLSLEDKAKSISQANTQSFLKVLPMMKVSTLIKEFFSSGKEKEIEALGEKFIRAWQEKSITGENLGIHLREMLSSFIQVSPDKLLPEFIIKLLKFFAEDKGFVPIFFSCFNPFLEKIAQIMINSRKFSLMQGIMRAYEGDAQNTLILSDALNPIASHLVEELIRRIDLNLDWTELSESFILLKDQAVKLLIDKALFEKGISEGKYFEAYLRRRTIGRILAHISKESILSIMIKEIPADSPDYMLKNLIEIVGAMEHEEIVGILRIPLHSPNIIIRRKAVFALSKMKGQESALLLTETLKDTDTKIARESLSALKARKDHFAADALKAAKEDKNLTDDIRREI